MAKDNVTKKSNRKKLSADTESEVMFRANVKCCICKERGDHIHHLDSDSSNNDFLNLVLLCFKHHDEASMTNNLRKKLSQKTLIKHRDQLYREIEAERNISKNNLNNSVTQLSENDLLKASLAATILIEIAKIQDEYEHTRTWNSKSEVLKKLMKFSQHSDARVVYELFGFLSEISYEARRGMDFSVAFEIRLLVLRYFTQKSHIFTNEECTEIITLAVNIGFELAYNAVIHGDNLFVAECGFEIIHEVYPIATELNLNKSINKINSCLRDLVLTFKRPERDDLGNGLQLANIYQEHIAEFSVASFVPKDLYLKIQEKAGSYAH